MDSIFFVTVMVNLDDRPETNPPRPIDSKCVGWTKTLTDAEKLIRDIGPGLVEARFDHLVIEESSPGYCTDLLEMSWWKFDDDENCWQRAERPYFVEGIIHFAH